MKPLEELLGAESLQALDRDTAQARGLPGAAYQAGFYALEQAALFPAQWCAIGYASDLPEPGDIVPVDLAGSPVILVRGQDANIAAFHNVCRHRGMRALPAPQLDGVSMARLALRARRHAFEHAENRWRG